MFDARFKYSVEGDMYSVYLIATERGGGSKEYEGVTGDVV